MKKLSLFVSILVLASLLLAACSTAATPKPEVVVEPATEVPATEAPAPEPTAAPIVEEPAWVAPEGSLVAIPVDTAPTLDGVADDAVWADATPITVEVSGGFGGFETEAQVKAAYSDDTAYFVVTYADPTESFLRAPWQKQEDGTWKVVKDPEDVGGDNNLVYEDKMAIIWNIDNSIAKFETAGCFVACHAGENDDVKPYGNKYTANEGEMGDIWHWKSIRNIGQIHDQYLDSTRFSEDTKEAGRHSDKSESGGYVTNQTEDKTLPAFTSPEVDNETGYPGYILDSEKVAIDQAGLDELPVGSYIPGIVKSAFVGDGGDISAAWKWENGVWTIELSRKLVTGSEYDVQFDDLSASYYFGVAVFNNAQVRHAYQTGSSFMVFQPK